MRNPKPIDIDKTIDEVMKAEYEWLESLDTDYIALRKPRPAHHYLEEWDHWD